MKKLLLLLLFTGNALYAQSIVGNNNSGSLTTATYSHGVGEIYVVPQSPNAASGGTIAATTQIVFGTLATNDHVIAKGVTYYPNPVQDYLTIELKEAVDLSKAEIYDMKGSKITAPIKDNRVDMGSLAPGIYFISFPNTNVKTIKIIKN
jgi:hypothetical protein